MNLESQIQEAYQSASNFPDLVRKLIETGVQSYTVETASGTILYRLPRGENHLQSGNIALREISLVFNEQLTIKAIRDNQEGKSDYTGFMDDIAKSGVRFYEATFTGPNKRVTYIGSGGHYEELIPL